MQNGRERPPARSSAVVPARTIRSDMEREDPNCSWTGSRRSRADWRFLLTDQSLPGENLETEMSVRRTCHDVQSGEDLILAPLHPPR